MLRYPAGRGKNSFMQKIGFSHIVLEANPQTWAGAPFAGAVEDIMDGRCYFGTILGPLSVQTGPDQCEVVLEAERCNTLPRFVLLCDLIVCGVVRILF